MASVKELYRKWAGSAALAVIAAAVIRCGSPHEEKASTLSGGVSAVETKAEIDLGGEQIQFLIMKQVFVSREDLGAALNDALGRSLGRYGVIPTNLPQFFSVEAKLSQFRDCYAWYYYLECNAAFTAGLHVLAKAGPDELGSSSMHVPFEPATLVEFKRTLRWSVDRLVDDLVEQGLLEQLGIETPYF